MKAYTMCFEKKEKEDKLSIIREKYFGVSKTGHPSDKTRHYILDDFRIFLYDLINLDLLHTALGEAKNENRREILISLERACLRGYSLDFRVMTKAERQPTKSRKINYFNGEPGALTGGDFINDLCKLTMLDLDNLTSFERKNNFKKLLEAAQTFKSEKNFKKLGSDLEAQLFHKDRAPIKKKVNSKIIESPGVKVRISRYTDAHRTQLKEMACCTEEFATIIELCYKCIPMSRNYFSLYKGTNLEKYIGDFFSIFPVINTQKEIENKLECYKKNLPCSLKIAEWT